MSNNEKWPWEVYNEETKDYNKYPKEYKEAMQRRGHNKLMMSPDYIRVFGVQPNMGWSIDRRRQGRGRDSTSKRLFG